ERPAANLVATDASEGALAVARVNASALRLSNVGFLEGDWLAPLAGVVAAAGGFDLIVSNPPYIAQSDPHLDAGDLRHEPRSALASGVDGLDDIRTIVRESPSCLAAGGWLLLEHGYDQGIAVRQLMHGAGFEQVRTVQDLEHRDRVTLACRARTQASGSDR
ncbi:MAG: peptide chain release factor N(5)-glutamine methyltransferase, partial [Pseudomonadota bacterium]|nr:peptide chain release factor N(5)-glutamine methyltransferase [Pseudomonadota bacterium]